MYHLSRTSRYALYAMVYLAAQPPDRFVPVGEIQRYAGVPRKRLAKIFQVLVKAGFLKSSTGRVGGFALAKAAGAIFPIDVIKVLEKPRTRPKQLDVYRHGKKDIIQAIDCQFDEAQKAVEKILSRDSLADTVRGA